MILRLTEDQLLWLLEDTRYKKDTVQMFRDHFVGGIPKQQAAQNNGITPHFSYKKWREFEKLSEEKCRKYGVKMSTIMHKPEDADKVHQYDIVTSQSQDKNIDK